VCSYDSVLVFFVGWDEFVEETEEFVYLLFGEIGIVGGVFDFESVRVVSFPGYDVGQGVEAGVAYWDADSVVAVLLKEFYQYAFAIEAALAPAT